MVKVTNSDKLTSLLHYKNQLVQEKALLLLKLFTKKINLKVVRLSLTKKAPVQG